MADTTDIKIHLLSLEIKVGLQLRDYDGQDDEKENYIDTSHHGY